MKPLERRLEALKFQLLTKTGRLSGIKQPANPVAQVVFAILTKRGLSADGKGSPEFFPPFCVSLRRRGIATYFTTTQKQLNDMLRKPIPTVLVNIFGEDHFDVTSHALTDAENQAFMVFNSSAMGVILADKELSLRHFTKLGVPMPPAATSDKPTFSNERFGTTRPVEVIEPGNKLDENRYNRALVDTTFDFEGRSYYTCVRLMCIGDRILHTFVRARPLEQNNPSVHTKDTPLEPALLRSLQKKLIDQPFEKHKNIAEKMYAAAGPAFFAHDLLVDRSTQDVFLCESGYKFDEFTFCSHIAPIRDELPFHRSLFPLDRYAMQSADAFIDLMKERGIEPA